jgi:hypothetical protein
MISSSHQTIIILTITILIIWLLYGTYKNSIKTLVKYNMEHMVDLKPPGREISWTMDPKCNYKMTQVFTDILKEYGIKKNNKDWVIYFPCSYNHANAEINKVKPSNPDQRVFIVTNTDEISSKSDLWKNIVKKYGREEALKMSPKTYILYNDSDLELFKKEFNPSTNYILKKNIQRQEGIKITNDKNEILNGSSDKYVVAQELLNDPYLIRGRKTNMRFYLLLVCQNNEVDAYVHDNGFMYYTKVPFKKNSNKFNTNITTGYIERWIYKVNPMTHKDYRKYLDDPDRDLIVSEKEIINDGKQLSEVVFTRINDLLKKVVNSVKHKVCNGTHLQDHITFQLFGADIAVDDKMHPKIIEVNIGPNLSTHDGRDSEVKHTVVRDIFKVLKIVPDKDNGYIQII